MKPPIAPLLTICALAGLALTVAAQAPGALRAGVPPAKVRPVVRGQEPPGGFRTARDTGARDQFKPTGPDDQGMYPYGDVGTYREAPEGALITLQGNARLLYKETRFESERIVYNRKTQIGVAPGKLTVNDAQNTIVGDQGEANYGKKVARIQGNVTITARPKPGTENAPEGSARREFKEPVTIQGSETIYNWKTKIADLSKDTVIHFTAKDRKWTLTADKIQYRGKDETAVLTGNVVAKSNEGDVIHTLTATVVLTEGKESLDTGQISETIIKVKDEDEEEKPDDKAAPPPVKPDEKKTNP